MRRWSMFGLMLTMCGGVACDGVLVDSRVDPPDDLSTPEPPPTSPPPLIETRPDMGEEAPPARPSREFECRTGERDPGPALVRRLTVPEYITTVRQTVGVDIEASAKESLPKDVRADGFTNTAYNLTVDLEHIEAWSQLASEITATMDVGAFLDTHGRCGSLEETGCVEDFVASAGLVLLRQPLAQRDIDAFMDVAEAVRQEQGDFQEGARWIVEAMLQSPKFLYRVEDQRGDGTVRALNAYEVASRLSYLIWGGPPDDALYAAARDGRLATVAGVEAEVTRMLQDPKARQTSQRFAYDWLALGRQETLSPDPGAYPEFTPALGRDFNRETLAFLDHIWWDARRPIADIFDAQVTFATPRLAEFYGLAPKGDGLQRYDLSDVPERGGLLTHASILTVGGDGAEMVPRGLFMLHDVLCGHVSDPPPGVDLSGTDPMPGLSQRMIAEERIDDPKCGGCHVQFEPLAFGLEPYDGIGGYADIDHLGNALRQDGALPVPGSSSPAASYTTTAEFGALLASTERVQECMTLKVTQFALGRNLLASDACLLADVRAQMKREGNTYASLITAIATSDLVRATRTASKE